MSAPPVTCTKCTASLPGDFFNLPEPVACPGCGQNLQVEVFPALFQRFAPGRAGEAILDESESSCFYHPQKKAVLPCDSCGRFLCALCDCELDGQHICPACLETGKKKGKIQSLQNHRVLYDSMALGLTWIPMLLFPLVYFTFMTAPLALFIAIRHWNTPSSIVRRTKARYVAAIIIATLQLAGWVLLILAIYFAPRHRIRHF
jgi:hypothetical protein